MKSTAARSLALLLLALPGCGPRERVGPKLEQPLMYTEDGYAGEQSLFMATPGMLTLSIDVHGEANSIVRRSIVADVKRRESLTDAQYMDLVTRVEGWLAREGDKMPVAQGKVHGSVTYGTKRATWDKDAALGPELAGLTKFLHDLVNTLQVEANYGRKQQ